MNLQHLPVFSSVEISFDPMNRGKERKREDVYALTNSLSRFGRNRNFYGQIVNPLITNLSSLIFVTVRRRSREFY